MECSQVGPGPLIELTILYKLNFPVSFLILLTVGGNPHCCSAME